MTDPAGPPSGKVPQRTTEETRVPDLGPGLKRDRMLARVRVARRRLSRIPGALARVR